MFLGRTVASLAVCGAALLPAGRAQAQDTRGAWQVGLSTDLLTYFHANIENDDTGIEEERSLLTWGVRDNVAVELGYGIHEMLVFGAFLRLGGRSETQEPPLGVDVEITDVAIQVGPKLDVLLGDRSSELRPYVGLAVALSSTIYRDEDAGLETSLVGGNLQGRIGLHWFVLPSLSIDPMFAAAYGIASGEVDEIDGTDSLDISASGFNVGLIFGVSGWIP